VAVQNLAIIENSGVFAAVDQQVAVATILRRDK
jgi:hypothetical protein